MELLWLSDVTSIPQPDRRPIVCRWTLNWNFIFLTVASPVPWSLRLSLLLAQKAYAIILCPLLVDTPVCSTFPSEVNFGRAGGLHVFLIDFLYWIQQKWGGCLWLMVGDTPLWFIENSVRSFECSPISTWWQPDLPVWLFVSRALLSSFSACAVWPPHDGYKSPD